MKTVKNFNVDSMNSRVPTAATTVFFKLNKKFPIYFSLVSLFVFYILQYPIQQLLSERTDRVVEYTIESWYLAYAFVIISTLVFTVFLYVGLTGKTTRITTSRLDLKLKKPNLLLVVLIFFVFFIWSYVMLTLKIGMTIYADFDPLPYKLTGLLFYGRLFIQPFLLIYVARAYIGSNVKFLIVILITMLGAWVVLTSGSRFAAILFSLPFLVLFDGRRKYLILLMVVLGYITIASLSRSFYLPFHINYEYVRIYAGDANQARLMDNIYMLPISYIAYRMMGIGEVLLTLNFGAITPSDMDSFLSFLSYFLPLVPGGNTVSMKNIYGFSDDVFGGFGLDMFSNYWVSLGGNPVLYGIGLALIGWLLGKNYRFISLAFTRLGLREGSMFAFILMFLLVRDNRGSILLYILPIAWILSKKSTHVFLFSIIRSFTIRS